MTGPSHQGAGLTRKRWPGACLAFSLKIIMSYLRPCFGYSEKKGGAVGERHRWSGPAWGMGKCIWCARHLQELTVTSAKHPPAESSLPNTLKNVGCAPEKCDV